MHLSFFTQEESASCSKTVKHYLPGGQDHNMGLQDKSTGCGDDQKDMTTEQILTMTYFSGFLLILAFSLGITITS